MSADNGIYVTSFPNGVFRVIEASAIENVLDTPEYCDQKLTDAYRVLYYGKAKTFSNKDEAWKAAKELNYQYTEYGICEIQFDRDLPEMSEEEARAMIRSYWAKQGKS